ncbi:activating signal cointegrator 1 complex subunit 1 [Diachasma alloeum]|uniref:activating signal cointegrator 1 complex subunit 1 n=1 Tax=Diachasma alloeum TaxID=454923 RepID=UPI0007381FF3|nr:activating signal cointegrator 1 complex subunit 1 [Diachasma alloeum]
MDNESELCESVEIEEISDGSYRHSFIISKAFYGFIFGRLDTIKDLQSETNTTIPLPDSRKSWSGDVCILGSSREEIITCREKIHRIAEDSRKNIRYTHFVSIPLNNDEFKGNYKAFREQILRDPTREIHGIVDEMFVGGNKLHLTVGMLLLLDDEEKRKAAETLEKCVEDVVQPILTRETEPIRLKIEGLECMNSNPAKASILYGRVEENRILQELVDKVFGYFIEKGLMKSQYDNKVKLHMTLMKTSRLRGKSKKHQRQRTFDATKILEDFGNYEFGETTLDTLHICECSTDVSDGSYPILTRIDLIY